MEEEAAPPQDRLTQLAQMVQGRQRRVQARLPRQWQLAPAPQVLQEPGDLL